MNALSAGEAKSLSRGHRAAKYVRMSKRSRFYLVASIAAFALVFLFFKQIYNEPSIYHVRSTTSSAPIKSSKEPIPTAQFLRIQKPKLAAKVNQKVSTTLNETHRVIDHQREMIRDNMRSYRYPNGRYNQAAKKLEDLLIEENGKPIRSIILTTWRSGSTFFGDIINAHPGNFYHYEPLIDFDIVQIRGPPLADKALERVRALLKCEYADLVEYIEYGKTHPWVFNHNTHLWKHCKNHQGWCHKREFLGKICKLFPFQSMKLVRLRLNVAKELLADKNLGVRIVLLVRDPRGTLQSRKHRNWCPSNRDCSDPALVCADLASDYKIARELLKKYPTTFRVIRYEDLSAHPYQSVKELCKFYGLDFHPNMKKFLDTHTKRNHGGHTSTSRDSKAAPYHWKTELEFEEVDEIQSSCLAAMEHWGYVQAINASHQKEFNPVTDYFLSS